MINAISVEILSKNTASICVFNLPLFKKAPKSSGYLRLNRCFGLDELGF
jgi:hypothetical protein